MRGQPKVRIQREARMSANTPRANPRVNPRPASRGSGFNPGTLLVGFYQPLNTPVHRAPLWFKGTLFFGLFIVLAVTGWQVALVALAAATLCALWAGVSASQLWLVVRTLALLLLIMAAYYVLTSQYASGADAIATMLTAFYASRTLLVSTPLPVLIDGFVRLCSPLRFMGLSPERLGLLIALMIRSIPALVDRWGALQRAAVARDLPRRMYWRLLIPWVVQAVDYATATARALRARRVDELK